MTDFTWSCVIWRRVSTDHMPIPKEIKQVQGLEQLLAEQHSQLTTLRVCFPSFPFPTLPCSSHPFPKAKAPPCS